MRIKNDHKDSGWGSALMGAILYAILGLISGIISAIGIAIGVSAIQNALPATTSSAREQASRLPLLWWLGFGFIGAISLWQL